MRVSRWSRVECATDCAKTCLYQSEFVCCEKEEIVLLNEGMRLTNGGILQRVINVSKKT